jgi:hypothetical protein
MRDGDLDMGRKKSHAKAGRHKERGKIAAKSGLRPIAPFSYFGQGRKNAKRKTHSKTKRVFNRS